MSAREIDAGAMCGYLERIGLGDSRLEVEEISRCLAEIDETAATSAREVSGKTALREFPAQLLSFSVPKLGEGGTCSIQGELDETPFEVAREFAGGSDLLPALQRLFVLDAILERVADEVGCEWLGIYQAVRDGKNPRLRKLVYRGSESRAEFPLTQEFAAGSSNSQVGLSGKAVLIENVESHLASAGAYYECDRAVQSEVCLPVFANSGRGLPIGIIDAEAHSKRFFSDERLCWLLALCLGLSDLLS